MTTSSDIGRYLSGVERLTRNDAKGFHRLDLTADGFWTSFAAIPYALPAFAVSWMHYRGAYAAAAGDAALTGLGFYVRLALIDIVNWLAPILIVAFVAAPLGLSANFARWVIATNWLSLPVAYVMAVPVALMMIAPSLETIAVIMSLVFFVLVIAVFFRVTRLAFDNDVPVALAITVGLVVLSFAMTGMLQAAFGLSFEPIPS
ncbi:hypothetical protein [Pararhizobium haloflavum]|uniref:hypothetical protein n=1 Tax=Pararhizobium haloflavum TaxID=2037914 RepID=UPI000C18E48F|nr:hypothetical protein [Pararhizobium haloflavum]